jgi:hypothetical protein
MDQQSLQYQLQRLEVGMVWLDKANHVTAFNDIAWQLLSRAGEETLGIDRSRLVGIDAVKLHPAKSREKVALLLGSDDPAGIDRCPVASPAPVTMMINIPDRVLLLKVSKMVGENGAVVGACMIYYDLTELTTSPAEIASAVAASGTAPPAPVAPRRLNKIPVYHANRLVLIDLAETLRLESNDHYTWIVTATGKYLSNLALSDVEERLDPAVFFRCHRSHIVNLHHVNELARDGDAMYIVFALPEPARVPVSRSYVRQLREIVGM